MQGIGEGGGEAGWGRRGGKKSGGSGEGDEARKGDDIRAY